MPATVSIIFSAASDVLVTDLDTEMILIGGKSGETFRLNGTACELWRQLPATAEALAKTLSAHYGIEPAQAVGGVAHTIGSLERSGLIERAPESV